MQRKIPYNYIVCQLLPLEDAPSTPQYLCHCSGVCLLKTSPHWHTTITIYYTFTFFQRLNLDSLSETKLAIALLLPDWPFWADDVFAIWTTFSERNNYTLLGGYVIISTYLLPTGEGNPGINHIGGPFAFFFTLLVSQVISSQ